MKKLRFFSMVCILALAIGSLTGCHNDETGYVDLGLPSGTKWKAANEGGYYDYDSAMEAFGSKLPTKEQFEELMSLCTFTWDSERKGANFVSTVNGESIFLPASGYRFCSGDADDVGTLGSYWSSTPFDSGACYLIFFSSGVDMFYGSRCIGQSVRLVQD